MNENTQNQNVEISLLDLFTVLLRYRKLIVGITLVFIILAVIGYFIYPVQQYNKDVNNSLAQGRIIISIKQNMQNYFNRNPEYFINRADVVMDSLRDAGMDKFEYASKETVSLTDETERTRALFIIDQILILNKNLNGKDNNESDRKFQVITNTTKIPGTTRNIDTIIKDNFSVEVSYKDKDPVLIRSFLKNLIIYGNEIAGDYIRSLAEITVNNYEQIMDGAHTGLSWESAMGENIFYYAYMKNFLEGKETILTALGEPVITKPEIFLTTFQKDYIKKGIILVLAGFVIAVVLAFILNAIRNIKNDEEAMKKIRDAMGNSGEK